MYQYQLIAFTTYQNTTYQNINQTITDDFAASTLLHASRSTSFNINCCAHGYRFVLITKLLFCGIIGKNIIKDGEELLEMQIYEG